jgi:hypothetical protein
LQAVSRLMQSIVGYAGDSNLGWPTVCVKRIQDPLDIGGRSAHLDVPNGLALKRENSASWIP